MPLASCSHAQAAIELGVALVPRLARLRDAQASGDVFCAVLGYRIGVLANGYGREQLLIL